MTSAHFPMSTAPKDGTFVLIYSVEYGWSKCSWSNSMTRETKSLMRWCIDGTVDGDYGFYDTVDNPICWSPLPVAPTLSVVLSKYEVEEVTHKISILRDEPELYESYGLSESQAEGLLDSIPPTEGEWVIPYFANKCVLDEMRNHFFNNEDDKGLKNLKKKLAEAFGLPAGYF